MANDPVFPQMLDRQAAMRAARRARALTSEFEKSNPNVQDFAAFNREWCETNGGENND